jgi:hypothetical protein
MRFLLALFVSTRPPRPVFAEEVDAERAMRIAELKWLLAQIAEDREAPAWPA